MGIFGRAPSSAPTAAPTAAPEQVSRKPSLKGQSLGSSAAASSATSAARPKVTISNPVAAAAPPLAPVARKGSFYRPPPGTAGVATRPSPSTASPTSEPLAVPPAPPIAAPIDPPKATTSAPSFKAIADSTIAANRLARRTSLYRPPPGTVIAGEDKSSPAIKSAATAAGAPNGGAAAGATKSAAAAAGATKSGAAVASPPKGRTAAASSSSAGSIPPPSGSGGAAPTFTQLVASVRAVVSAPQKPLLELLVHAEALVGLVAADGAPRQLGLPARINAVCRVLGIALDEATDEEKLATLRHAHRTLVARGEYGQMAADYAVANPSSAAPPAPAPPPTARKGSFYRPPPGTAGSPSPAAVARSPATSPPAAAARSPRAAATPAAAARAPAATATPYDEELAFLLATSAFGREEIVAALERTSGDVERAIGHLLISANDVPNGVPRGSPAASGSLLATSRVQLDAGAAESAATMDARRRRSVTTIAKAARARWARRLRRELGFVREAELQTNAAMCLQRAARSRRMRYSSDDVAERHLARRGSMSDEEAALIIQKAGLVFTARRIRHELRVEVCLHFATSQPVAACIFPSRPHSTWLLASSGLDPSAYGASLLLPTCADHPYVGGSCLVSAAPHR